MTVRYIADCDEPRRITLTALAEKQVTEDWARLTKILSHRLCALCLPAALLVCAEMTSANAALKSLTLLLAITLFAILWLRLFFMERDAGKPALCHFNDREDGVWHWVSQLPDPRFPKAG